MFGRMSAIVVSMVVMVSACSDSASPTTAVPDTASGSTPRSTRVVATEVADDPAVEAAVAYIDARNRGVGYGDELFEQIVKNAGQHYEVFEPCRVVVESSLMVAADAGHSVVECGAEETFEYFGAGGLVGSGVIAFLVDADGEIIDVRDNFYEVNGSCCPALSAFNRAFHGWLESAQPGVFAQIDPGVETWLWPGFASSDPSHMLLAIDYVDEFVAQSADYPIAP